MRGAAWLAALADAVSSVVFPARCPACGAYCERRGGWCAPCLSRTVRPHRLALSAEALAALDDAWAVGFYGGALGTLVRDLKYRGRRGVLPYIHAALAAAKLPEQFLAADLAVYVPLHEAREKERGFNQAELIFAAWLKAKDIPARPLLQRTRSTVPQYGLDEKERRKNVCGAFSLSEAGKGGAGEIAGKSIVLLDDILTTGATLTSCAAVLKQAGAGSVYALALASDRS
ncbi:ComF family protein [uncultured Selenomonas sp.]|uniref:ComF family protein n=1 Tax=uncultured Selenomonas sp. TaxID=159275 RepID=UPI0026346E24|nr:phosphoribosyltransferase family protein [uncultured Selenomonas sp.]